MAHVMDALETANQNIKNNHQSLRAKASKLIESMQLSRIGERKSVSLGNDLRMESERLVGSGLEFEDNVIQMSVFSSGNGTGTRSKMRRGLTLYIEMDGTGGRLRSLLREAPDDCRRFDSDVHNGNYLVDHRHSVKGPE